MFRFAPHWWTRRNGVRLGSDVRLISVGGGTFGSEPYLIEIGDHVTVCGRVQFVTHDGGVWVLRHKYPDIDVFGPINVGNNVFIGFGSIIMPNVTIGNNVVIGAGSVVNRDIPDDVVVAGIPAKVIKSLADYEQDVLKSASFIKGLKEREKRDRLEQQFIASPP